MIPKFLLKEVLFYKEQYKIQTEITRLIINGNYIEYTSEVSGNPYNYVTHNKINIYELAHRCKEWALDLGYILYSNVYRGECYIDSRSFSDNTPVKFLSESEPEAIFKACEWILKQVEKK